MMLKKLADIADIVAGQIMTRVTSNEENQDSIHVKVLQPRAIISGAIDHNYLGTATITKELSTDKYTSEGDIIIKLSTPYDAAYISNKEAGLVIPSFCVAIRIKYNYVDPYYLLAVLNSQYTNEVLKSKIVGSARPMIKISDLKALPIPLLDEHSMAAIGSTYVLSNQKKALLQDMIKTEDDIMSSIILKSVKEALK